MNISFSLAVFQLVLDSKNLFLSSFHSSFCCFSSVVCFVRCFLFLSIPGITPHVGIVQTTTALVLFHKNSHEMRSLWLSTQFPTEAST